MKNAKEKHAWIKSEIFIGALEKPSFGWRFTNLIDKGRDNFTEETVAEAKRQIREQDAEATAAGKILIMTADFQDMIVESAAALAKESVTDVLRFVKQNLFFEGDDENE